jgi:predicted lipoprotein with Yx(FWY)xxD motif
MNQLKPLVALASLGALALAGTAFASTPHVTAPAKIVSTKHTSLGTILVTGSGQTLYLDTGDKPPHFACTGACLKAWPPLKAIGTVKASGAAKAALLGATNGPGGKTVTYNGHPLYTFISDNTHNPTSGEGQHGFYVVSPTGNKIAKTTTTSTSTSTQKKPPSKPPGY